MCEPKSSGVSLRGVLLAVGVLLCLPVVGAVARVFGSLLVAAAVMVYAAVVVSGWATVRLLVRTAAPKPVKVAAPARRSLPAAPRAIEAPRVILVTPADVLATPIPQPPAGRRAGRG